MTKEEFENWLDVDNGFKIIITMTTSEICQAVIVQKEEDRIFRT